MPAVAAPAVRSPQIAPERLRFRWDQYLRMIEVGVLDGARAMFIHGEIVTMAAMKQPHAIGISQTLHELQRLFGSGFYVRVQMPLEQAGNDPEPDLAVLPGVPRDHQAMPATALLVVEVADSSFYYDTRTKAEIYAAAGLADYWVLDVVDRQLIVFREPTATGYQSKQTLAETDTVSPLAAPSAAIRVADLLP